MGEGSNSLANETRSARPLSDRDRWALGVVVVLGALLTLGQAIVRPGFVLDDWYALRNVRFEGALHAADSGLRVSRPGAALTFGVAFGYFDHDRIGFVLLRMAFVVAAAALAFLILRRFVPAVPAMAVACLWLVLPNHMSLEFWPSALVSSVSLVAVMVGWMLLCRDPVPAWSLALTCLLFAFAVLTYESNALPAAVSAVTLPWLVTGRPRWRPVLAVGATLTVTTLWSVTHWHSVKRVQNDLGRYPDVVQAHFGWGVFPDGPVARLGLVAFVVGALVAVLRLLLPSFRRGAGVPERLVVAGLAVMLVGSVTFAFYFYAPLGAGDRVSYMSSLGGAMVMVGLAWMVWRWRREVAVAVVVAVLAAATVARVDRTRTWVTAGRDADRIVAAVRSTDASCDAVYLGPAPIQRQNVAAFLDASNVDGAVQVALGRRDVAGFMVFDEATFDRMPAECRVDIRPLSELEPDVVVGPN